MVSVSSLRGFLSSLLWAVSSSSILFMMALQPFLNLSNFSSWVFASASSFSRRSISVVRARNSGSPRFVVRESSASGSFILFSIAWRFSSNITI